MAGGGGEKNTTRPQANLVVRVGFGNISPQDDKKILWWGWGWKISPQDHKKFLWWGRVICHKTNRPKDHKKILWWGRILKNFTTRRQENLVVGVDKIYHKTTRKSSGGDGGEKRSPQDQKKILWWG